MPVDARSAFATIGTATPSISQYFVFPSGIGLGGVIVPDTTLSGAVFTPHGKALLAVQSRISLLPKLLPSVVGASNTQPPDVCVALA